MMLPKTFRAIRDPKPQAIFIACGDPRFQDAIDEFRRKVLDLPNGKFIPIRNGGGPTPLAYPTEMPSRCKGMTKQILFFCDKFPSINRIILIAHGDCAYYSTVPRQCHGHGQEKKGLPLAGSLVKTILPHQHIELYYAELINGRSEVHLEEVQVSREERTLPLPFDLTKSYQLS